MAEAKRPDRLGAGAGERRRSPGESMRREASTFVAID